MTSNTEQFRLQRPPLEVYLAAWGCRDAIEAIVRELNVDWDAGHLDAGDAVIDADAPWPFTPDSCGFAIYAIGHRTRDGRHFCPGCGLEGS